MTTTRTPPVYVISSPAVPHGLRHHFSRRTASSVVVITARAGDAGLRQLVQMVLPYRRQYHDTVIMPSEQHPHAAAAIRGLFDDVATAAEFRFLPEVDLVAALKAHDADDRAVGACYSEATGLLTFITGDRQRLNIAADTIADHPVMGAPDLAAIALTDGGHTVTFGAGYEVAFDGLRYAHDPGYRAAVRKRARDQDQTFGARLRRARFHRRLGQGDLGVGARTIRRIEHGDMPEGGLRPSTRRKIETALGLSLADIRSF
jgi:hypothetical protein